MLLREHRLPFHDNANPTQVYRSHAAANSTKNVIEILFSGAVLAQSSMPNNNNGNIVITDGDNNIVESSQKLTPAQRAKLHELVKQSSTLGARIKNKVFNSLKASGL